MVDAGHGDAVLAAINSHDALLAACQATTVWYLLDGNSIAAPVRQQIYDAIAAATNTTSKSIPSPTG